MVPSERSVTRSAMETFRTLILLLSLDHSISILVLQAYQGRGPTISRMSSLEPAIHPSRQRKSCRGGCCQTFPTHTLIQVFSRSTAIAARRHELRVVMSLTLTGR